MVYTVTVTCTSKCCGTIVPQVSFATFRGVATLLDAIELAREAVGRAKQKHAFTTFTILDDRGRVTITYQSSSPDG